MFMFIYVCQHLIVSLLLQGLRDQECRGPDRGMAEETSVIFPLMLLFLNFRALSEVL